MKKNKMKLWKKITLITMSSILGLIIILIIAVFAIWKNEINSITSIKQLAKADEENKSGPVYQIEYKGNYYFEKFEKQGGAKNDSELIQFIVNNITKGIIPMEIGLSDIGCSSFTAKTASGDRLFGRNYDFSKTTAMIVHTKPTDGRFESYSSVDTQFLGIKNGIDISTLMNKFLTLAAPYAPLDGINSAGVSCGIYMSYQGSKIDEKTGEVRNVATDQQDKNKPDITSTTLLRLILDRADSVEKAIELAQMYNMHDSANTSFHYMVADKDGKSAILEYVPENGNVNNDNDGTKRVLKVYRNDSDSALGSKEAMDNFQYITNFIVTPNYYDNDEAKAGLDRYNEIRDMINPDGTNVDGVIDNEQKALAILERVGRRNWDKIAGKTDGNGCTVWSVVYNLSKKTVTWVNNEKFGKEVFTYSL